MFLFPILIQSLDDSFISRQSVIGRNKISTRSSEIPGLAMEEDKGKWKEKGKWKKWERRRKGEETIAGELVAPLVLSWIRSYELMEKTVKWPTKNQAKMFWLLTGGLLEMEALVKEDKPSDDKNPKTESMVHGGSSASSPPSSIEASIDSEPGIATSIAHHQHYTDKS
ncbi:unnamed protein product [Lactuca virosa]|uniref:Uncharacterized protein n=1 Tax=Lactuca virosa TaxID=75947 RepID=A0AAU9NQT9_9ASTR|nr:unnamed protein product [Lactuca virosa]